MGGAGAGDQGGGGLALAVAEAAAGRSAAPPGAWDGLREQYVLMRAGGLSAAVVVGDLRELLELRGTLIRSLPNLAPPFVGLARRRGHLLVVADLGLVLGGGACTVTGKARLAVLRCGDDSLALVVDEVTAVAEAGSEDLGSLAQGAWSSQAGVVRAGLAHGGAQHLVVDVAGVWGRLRELVPVREGGTWPRG